MNERLEWNRRLFETLTSNRLSRNKYFTKFASEWFQAVHRRYRIVASLKREAARLGAIPGSNCWVSDQGNGLLFHLQSPPLRYRRVVALQPYEWEWLFQQQEIQSLLQEQGRQALPGL